MYAIGHTLAVGQLIVPAAAEAVLLLDFMSHYKYVYTLTVDIIDDKMHHFNISLTFSDSK